MDKASYHLLAALTLLLSSAAPASAEDDPGSPEKIPQRLREPGLQQHRPRWNVQFDYVGDDV